jgi:hypothetical protein
MPSFQYFVIGVLASSPNALAAAPADDPKARDVLDRAKTAMGGAAWDKVKAMHESLAIETSGLKGKAEGWTDALTGCFSSRYELGPDSGAEGWDGKTYWTQDHSGQVRPQSGGDGVISAKTEAYRNAFAYWYPSRARGTLTYLGKKDADGHSYDVVRATPEGGRDFFLWIDTSTHRIERMVEKKEIDTVTSTYSDWRSVNGVMVPFGEVDSIGQAKYDQISKILSVDFPASVPTSQFAPPAPPAADFAFASGVDRVTLPFELNNNHIYLPTKINGKQVTVVFDTGATNYLYKESLPKVGVKAEGALPGSGVGDQKEDTSLAKVDSVQLGDLTIKNQIFAVASSGGWPAIEGAPSDGLLGYEVVKRVPTIIDYEHRQVTFVKPEAFRSPTTVQPVSFRFAEHLPEIDGSIDGIPAKMHIDTGSRSTIDLTGPFVEKNNLIAKYNPKWEATTGWGVGGPARARLARAHTLILGNQTVKDPVIELTAQSKGAFSSAYYDGNIGGDILRRFTLTLDYAHQNLWLEPNATMASPFVFDRTGMFLAVDGDSFLVKDVTAHGPADNAGLKAGDHIVRINGKSPAEMPLPRLREWIKSTAPGTKVPVKLSRGRKVMLTLVDLV